MSLVKRPVTRYVPAVAASPGQPYSHTCPSPPPGGDGAFASDSGASSGGGGTSTGGGCQIIPIPTGNGGIYYWNTCVDEGG